MQQITVEQLKARLDNGEKLNVLDVREASEYAEDHLDGILVPLPQILAYQIDDLEQYKEQELIIYCRSGNRSMQACLALETAGFENVVNVMGGIVEWRKKFG